MSSCAAGTPPAPATHFISGTVSGLAGSGLVLRNNGGGDLAVSTGANSFTFATTLVSGATYDVTVSTQPSGPAQTCVTANNFGTIANANITAVQITCTMNSYRIGGSVSGLAGTGLVLRDNGGDDLAVPANAGSFMFATPIASAGSYSVTVFSQPSSPSQTCVAATSTGTVTNANVAGVQITCTTNSYHIGGSISGLTSAGLVLRDNGGDDLAVPANAGSFVFATPILSAGSYDVTVATQASSPGLNCAAANNSGTVTSADITTVQINCLGPLSISPSPSSVHLGWAQQFAATVPGGGGSRTATWSVNGIAGGSTSVGTIDATGRYTAPQTAPSPATVTISAVDQQFSNLTASVSVSLTGLFAYVTNQTGGTLSSYLVNGDGS